MHEIEPYYNWRQFYQAEKDELSPFFENEYSEFEFTSQIYDHVIHPQWDHIGSETLYIKILYANYSKGFCVIEMFGEWNDALHNDIMHLKRNIIEHLVNQGITQFILIGENVFNFHGSDDSYYEEWFDDIEDGWILGIGFPEHLLAEMGQFNLDSYIIFGGEIDLINWRTMTPEKLYLNINNLVIKRLH